MRRLFLEMLEDRRMLDGAGPRILSYTPDEVRNATFDHIAVTFDREIDASTFTAADVRLSGPGGDVAVASVVPLGSNEYQINFDTLTDRGSYQAIIGPNIADPAGNLMDQDGDGVAGESGEDAFSTTLVYIDANVIFNTNATIAEGDTTFDGQDLLIDGATVAINGPHNFGSVHVINGGTLTHSANSSTQVHKLELVVGTTLIVDATSKIDVTGKGYLAGRTTGNTTNGGAVSQSGGSYGGLGGDSGTGNRPNNVYGDYRDPNDWGSGGGSSSGGGLVRITAATLDLDGMIQADGGTQGSGGLGSGGGVYIAVSALTGGGSIHGDGGSSAASNSIAGGGGRIAVYAADFGDFDLNSIHALGGNGTRRSGGTGTVYLRDTDEAMGTLVVEGRAGNNWTPLGMFTDDVVTIPDSVVIRGPHALVAPTLEVLTSDASVNERIPARPNVQVSIAGNLTIEDNGRFLRMDGDLEVAGEVVVQGTGTLGLGGVLRSPGLSLLNNAVITAITPSTTEAHKVELVVANTLSIDATSVIDVSGKGYLAGRTTGNTTVSVASAT